MTTMVAVAAPAATWTLVYTAVGAATIGVYSADPAIQIKLGMPPEGHKFVRVATDILLIAVGTGMVVDAIQDLGQ